MAISATVAEASAQDAPTGPRIRTATEIFDFGLVPQDAVVSHTYWLHNPGTEAAIIRQIKPNCGCTEIPPTDSTLAVGDSLPVEILFGTRNMTGKVEKFTRIMSNAEGRVPALTFKGVVYKKGEIPGIIAVTPEVVNTGVGTQGKFVVRNTGKSALTVRVVAPVSADIRLDTNEMSLGPDESKEVGVEFTLKAGQKDFKKSITLEANDSAKTRITVPITNVQKE